MGAKQSNTSAAQQTREMTSLDERGGWQEEMKDFESRKSPNQGSYSDIISIVAVRNDALTTRLKSDININ